MAHKQILFHSAAREKILRGATLLADAVRVTLGPKSKSVLIQKSWGAPIVCNDGVTIAKEIDLKDPEENLGAQILRQAAERTGDVVGDGTSTSTILAHAILADGVRNVVRRQRHRSQARTRPRTRVARDAAAMLARPDESREGPGRNLIAHNDPSSALSLPTPSRRSARRRDSVEESRPRNHAGRRRGHEIRPRLHIPYFVTDAERMKPCWKIRSCCFATTRSPRDLIPCSNSRIPSF